MSRPDLSRVPAFYHQYIDQVQQDNLVDAMQEHQKHAGSFLQSLAPHQWDYRYAEDKWTIKELVQHLIDSERIFCYRALTFARKDSVALPGFDENKYAAASDANRRTAEDLLKELKAVQQSSALLFESFNDTQLEAMGIANGNPVYVKAIGFILVGHTLHHLQIIRERYL